MYLYTACGLNASVDISQFFISRPGHNSRSCLAERSNHTLHFESKNIWDFRGIKSWPTFSQICHLLFDNLTSLTYKSHKNSLLSRPDGLSFNRAYMGLEFCVDDDITGRNREILPKMVVHPHVGWKWTKLGKNDTFAFFSRKRDALGFASELTIWRRNTNECEILLKQRQLGRRRLFRVSTKKSNLWDRIEKTRAMF